MTITLGNNDPRAEYSVAEGVTQQVFAVPFEFFDDGDISVYVDGVLKIEGADYTISGGDGSTGTITFVTAVPPAVQQVTGAVGGSEVVIVRSIPIERTSDFSAGADINRAALNEQLDILTAMIADLRSRIDRSPTLVDYDVVDYDLRFPVTADRINKYLAFGSTGNLTAVNGTTSTIIASAFGETLIDDLDALEARGTLGLTSVFDLVNGAAIGSIVNDKAAIYSPTGQLLATTFLASTAFSAPDGTRAAPAFRFSNDTDTGFYRIGSNRIGVTVGDDLIANFASSGDGVLNMGDHSARSMRISQTASNTPRIQVEGTGTNTAISIIRNTATAGNQPHLVIGRSRGTSDGSNTAVQSGDLLGQIAFDGADGTNMVLAARISSDVASTVATDSVPTNLRFATTGLAGSFPVDRLILSHTGAIGVDGTNYGINGQVLTSAGAAGPPTWQDPVALTANATLGAVGTYAWLGRNSNTAAITAGTTYAGSTLVYAGVVAQNSYIYNTALDSNGATPSGTWRAMGTAQSGSDASKGTLFLRIS
jgi:hypothetical protein